MVTQVLIIHGRLPFAIKLKQTLERNAPFEVHPFTTLDSALDYLRDRVQDVALIDFSIDDGDGSGLIEALRAAQPDLALIVTPLISKEAQRRLDVQGTLDSDFTARDLIQVVDGYFRYHERPSLANTDTTGMMARQSAAQREIPKQPEDLPESDSFEHIMISSVDSRMFDSPHQEGDTPASSAEDFAALISDEPAPPDQSFDEVLSALPSDPVSEDTPPRSQFSDLVNSMRPESKHRPLPSRQQFVDFMMAGEMESLIDDGSDDQSDDDDSEPSRTFERLAKEEPPMPRFEESGTISDLITGVHEKSFQNVLSILRGEDVIDESEEVAPPEPTSEDFDVGERPQIKPVRRLEEFDFDMDDDQPTPAKVILQRTLEQSMTGEFSLEELLANIEQQLPAHRPKVLPLPSWLRESKRPEDPFVISEPDFLLKGLPSDMPEALPEEPTPVDTSENVFPDQTTQPSRAQQIEAHPENLETEWLDQPPRSREETVLYPPPETLPEEIPAESTVVHQPPADVPAEDESVAAWESWEADQVEPEAVEFESEREISAAWATEDDSEPAAEQPEEAFAESDAYDAYNEYDEAYAEAYAEAPTEMPEGESGWYDLESQDFNTQFELMAAFEVLDEEMGVTAPSGALYVESSVEPEQAPAPSFVPEQDPYIAQLALSLTEASLETTAEAALLTRDHKIIAYSGDMPEEEIEELRELIADDWDAQPGGGRIRFVTAQGSGTDYMLYSRRTEDDLTLSLIFNGTTPLRDIRRQGQRLINALLSVPEPDEVSATLPHIVTSKPTLPAAPEADDTTRAPYTYVWLLRDPNAYLDAAASQAIVAGLTVQLRELKWQIQALQVREDHVYLLADVPGEDPVYELVENLKYRSAEIAHAQNPAYPVVDLWSDGYLVVTPGRELNVEEIQQFINFERMS